MSDSSPTRRALQIGIDEYPNMGSSSQLEGCVNDVRLMHQVLLENFGFPGDNITQLLNADATREGILAAMEELLEETGENDVVVFQYAGHGSQMRDREGDEADGYDETLMPYDTGRRKHPNRDITDDEIHVWLQRLAQKTPHITLLFDCCHSGTITRDAFGLKARAGEIDHRPVSELPPSPVGGAARILERGPSGWLPLSDRYVVIAGCRDNESSYEYKPSVGGAAEKHGALTYHLCQALLRAGPGSTYRDVFDAVASKVSAAASHRQHPQLEGTMNRELFGVTDIVPTRSLTVSGRDGDAVTLAGGAAHGLTVGSEWEVHGEGAKHREGSEPLGTLRIVSVGAVDAVASVLEDRVAGGIAPNMRAFESGHHFGDFRWSVWVEGSEQDAAYLTEMREAIDASPMLALATDRAAADLCVYFVAPREEPADPVPQLGSVAEATWAVVGTDGFLAMNTHAASERGVAAVIRENCEKLARFRHLLDVENPADPALDGRIDVRVMGRNVSYEWGALQPAHGDGMLRVEHGQHFGIEVKNDTYDDVYVTIVNFGATAEIDPFHPNNLESERITPGQTMRVGSSEYPYQFVLPPNFPFAPPSPSAPLPIGTEYFKVLVTTAPADFTWLKQTGTRSGARRGPRGMRDLMEPPSSGSGTRGVLAPVVPDDASDGWTAITIPYLLTNPTTSSLDGGATSVAIAGATLSGAGLKATVTGHFGGSTAETKAVHDATPTLLRALKDTQIESVATYEISGAETNETVATRSAGGEPVFEFAPDAPPAGCGQFVMSLDEAGNIQLHLPQAQWTTRSAQGAQGARGAPNRYQIPLSSGQPDGVRTRGLAGVIGKRILKVFVFPLIERELGKLGARFVAKWEERYRPYRLRPVDAGNYNRAGAPVLDDNDWARLMGSRSLLLLHGTFDRTHTGFGSLSAAAFRRLADPYDGRVIGFDHFTLSHTPSENARRLLLDVPDGTELELDLLCHSRGGLIARALVEEHGALLARRGITVRNVVFVGTPNAGTAMASAKHLDKFISGYTNIFNVFDLLPDNGVTEILETVFTVAKSLATETAMALPGLEAMVPDGPYQKEMNDAERTTGAEYYAVASDFEPEDPGLKAATIDKVADALFEKAPNDLVVPVASVWGKNGTTMFPLARERRLQAAPSVAHAGYFGDDTVVERVVGWLGR